MTKKAEIRGGTSDLAKLLMITQRRVNQLADEGVIIRQIEGNFILPEAINEYYAYKYQSNETIDYLAEKAKHEKAKRELTELELGKRRRELHEASDVEAVLSEMLTNFRTQIHGIPSKMAPMLFGKSKADIEELLNQEIEVRLSEIRDYKPEMFDHADEEAE